MRIRVEKTHLYIPRLTGLDVSGAEPEGSAGTDVQRHLDVTVLILDNDQLDTHLLYFTIRLL